MVDISVSIAGLHLRNPTMLASGVLGMSGKLLKRVASAGAGAVVTKSIGPKPRPGHPNPTFVELPYGYLNAMGLPNPGIDEFVQEIKIAKESGVPVIVSVFGQSPEEFAYVAERAEKAGASAIEVNVSCPHAEVGLIGQDPVLTREVVRSVKERVKIPVFVKLTPNVTDITEIACAAEKAGADAVTAINTVKAMYIDIESAKPVLSNKIGGLSGPAIKPIAIRCVYEIYESVRIPIIGVGGIQNWKDAVEFFLAGASAIQVGSGVIMGLNIFRDICGGIKRYLERKGFTKLREIIGLAHR